MPKPNKLEAQTGTSSLLANQAGRLRQQFYEIEVVYLRDVMQK